MPRRVFFSFHYERDIWRANQVRNSWLTHPDRESAGFWDASLWEEAKKRGDEAVRRMIDQGLENTSVTAVLIGAETADRSWVSYEIRKSCERGNALLGVYIHNLRSEAGLADRRGDNPFLRFGVWLPGRYVSLTDLCRTYDWVHDDGYNRFGSWVDGAVRVPPQASVRALPFQDTTFRPSRPSQTFQDRRFNTRRGPF